MADRYSFERVQRLERRCLVPSSYTSRQEYDEVLAEYGEQELRDYVEFLEGQCGETFSALN